MVASKRGPLKGVPFWRAIVPLPGFFVFVTCQVTVDRLGIRQCYHTFTFTIQPWEPWKTWEPSGNLEETLKEPWGYLLGTLREPWQSNLGNLIETFAVSPWEPGPRLLGNLYLGTWEPWQPLLGKLGNLAGNLEGTLREPFGNLEGTLLGNLYLGTWEPLLGNLETLTWEPGNLYLGTFTWNLGTLGGFGAAPVCSETFTMAEDPKAFCCWGKKVGLEVQKPNSSLNFKLELKYSKEV